jgi:class 3 adenylate cyclase
LTVIGPVVNLVRRLENDSKNLNAAIVLSDDFARAYGIPLTSPGHHPLCGLAKAHGLFAPMNNRIGWTISLFQ